MSTCTDEYLAPQAQPTGWFAAHCTEPLRNTFELLRRRYRSKTKALGAKEYCIFALFLVMYTIATAAQFFGQNFWLASFWSMPSAKPTFATLLIPSAIWALLNLICCIGYKVVYGSRVSLTFWRKSPQGTLLLAIIGIADAFAGMTSVYSVPHIPTLLQTAGYAGGTIVVYIVHRIAYPATAVPLGPMLTLSFIFLLAGIGFAVIPVVLGGSTSLSAHPAWAFIFFLSILLPAIYNVFQGRFLGLFPTRRNEKIASPEDEQLLSSRSVVTSPHANDEANNNPSGTSKLVVLTGDYWVQLVVTALLFLPFDALPWFGASSSVPDAWDGFVSACHCIWWQCSGEYNFPYMLLYALGFWATRALLTFLNVYSPTAGALIGQATIPVVNLLLVIFPAWNVFGSPISIGYTIGCFIVMVISTMLYLAANESRLQEIDEEGERASTHESIGTINLHVRILA